MTAGSPILPL